jgi:Divergent InlB B-repeat domain
VIYAFPSDGADRFTALAGPIAWDVAAVDAWWRREDPSRTLRFDLFAFPGCASGAGQLDISRVQLQQPSIYYAATSTRAGRIVFELDRTFVDPAKKYLVYYDGPVEEPRICGQSSLLPDEGGRYAYSIVYAQACRADIGSGVVTANVAVHELTHNLGAVPPGGAPDACPGDSAHVCDDPDDLMYPYTRGQGLNAVKLDAGHNDYYDHGQGWWDLHNSTWLAHLDAPHHVLSVSFSKSTGTGQVTSDLPGIACPPTCSTTWDEGSKVTLTATAGEGSRFVGWSGACSAAPCTVTMGSEQTAVALFAAGDGDEPGRHPLPADLHDHPRQGNAHPAERKPRPTFRARGLGRSLLWQGSLHRPTRRELDRHRGVRRRPRPGLSAGAAADEGEALPPPLAAAEPTPPLRARPRSPRGSRPATRATAPPRGCRARPAHAAAPRALPHWVRG